MSNNELQNYVSFIQVLKTVKYGSAASPTQAIAKANKEVQKPAVGTAEEVNVVLTSGIALLYVPKLLSASMPVNVMQLQSQCIIRRSWRNR